MLREGAARQTREGRADRLGRGGARGALAKNFILFSSFRTRNQKRSLSFVLCIRAQTMLQGIGPDGIFNAAYSAIQFYCDQLEFVSSFAIDRERGEGEKNRTV